MARTDFDQGIVEPPVLELIRRERKKALSAREWKFRLRGYGYAIRQIGNAQVVTRLPQGTALGVLPAGLN